mgnify:CR=1 FL=1
MSETNKPNSGSFAQAFLPGLILGLVIGAVAGALLPDLLGGLEPASLERWFAMQAADRATGAGLHCAIVSAPGDFLGGCGLTNLNRRHLFANLYYWVRTSATRHGAA